MIEHKMATSYTLDRYPEHCSECPAFRQYPYQCHNERGMEGDCMLGYMARSDMRDFSGNRRFEGCRIESDPNVRLKPSAGEVISEFQKQCERDFLLANMPKLWVSVEDRLPSTPGKYIVCTAKGSVYCAPFRIFKTGDTAKGYFGADQYTIITHWMPLPAAPAKEET